MAIVTVKSKYQVVIPRSLRRQMRINVGDVLEASVQKGRITLVPKSLVDREIAEGLEDLKQGRTYGPYSSAAEMIASLHRMTSQSARRKAAKRR
jgi:AbrB family looped-hinge helix DNA binding protein